MHIIRRYITKQYTRLQFRTYTAASRTNQGIQNRSVHLTRGWAKICFRGHSTGMYISSHPIDSSAIEFECWYPWNYFITSTTPRTFIICFLERIVRWPLQLCQRAKSQKKKTKDFNAWLPRKLHRDALGSHFNFVSLWKLLLLFLSFNHFSTAILLVLELIFGLFLFFRHSRLGNLNFQIRSSTLAFNQITCTWLNIPQSDLSSKLDAKTFPFQ